MNKKTRNILLAMVAALVVGSCIFMFSLSSNSTVKEEIVEAENMEMIEANITTSELTKGIVVEQKFINKTENIKEVAVVFSRIYYLDGKDANTEITIELCDGKEVLCNQTILANDIPDQHRVYVNPINSISGKKGKELTLKIYENSGCDTGVSLMANSDAKTSYSFGNKKNNGSICFSIVGE